MKQLSIQIFKPVEPGEGRPLAGFCIHAGFESPGTDYEEERISLDEYVSKYPTAVYYIKVKGDCMEGSGIFEDDLLVVDRSLNKTVQSGDIIVGVLDGEFILAVYVQNNGKQYLVTDNPRKDYPPYEINEFTSFQIEGVVPHSILNQKNRKHVRANRLQQLLRQLRAGVSAPTQG